MTRDNPLFLELMAAYKPPCCTSCWNRTKASQTPKRSSSGPAARLRECSSLGGYWLATKSKAEWICRSRRSLRRRPVNYASINLKHLCTYSFGALLLPTSGGGWGSWCPAILMWASSTTWAGRRASRLCTLRLLCYCAACSCGSDGMVLSSEEKRQQWSNYCKTAKLKPGCGHAGFPVPTRRLEMFGALFFIRQCKTILHPVTKPFSSGHLGPHK